MSKERNERISMKQRIEELESELDDRERRIRELNGAISEKDQTFVEQLEQINDKVFFLQGELSKLTEYELKIDELNRTVSQKNSEIEQNKAHYQEKLQAKKKAAQQQKQEWSTIYNELLGEIKKLKIEIDSLGIQNKQLLSSINGGGIRPF